MKKLLFVCSRNRWRSPTAEALCSGLPGLDVDSAGLAPDAEVVLTAEQVAWADVIFVMEKTHKRKLQSRFPQECRHARVICLGIPDNYGYMDPELVEILRTRLAAFTS